MKDLKSLLKRKNEGGNGGFKSPLFKGNLGGILSVALFY
jgi:hypothetical protein